MNKKGKRQNLKNKSVGIQILQTKETTVGDSLRSRAE